MNDWPDDWQSGREKQLSDMDEDRSISVFTDHDVIYASGGERSDEWLWMENKPHELENKC